MAKITLTEQQKNKKAEYRSLFMKIKKAAEEKGKPINKTELGKVLKTAGVSFEDPEDFVEVMEISNLIGHSNIKLPNQTEQADSKPKDDEGNNSATTKSDLSEIKIKYKKIVNSLKKSVDKSGKVLTQDDVMEQLNNLGTKKNTVSIDEDDLGDFLIILKDEGIILDSVAPVTVSISELNRDEYLQLFNELEAVHKKSNKDFFSVDEVAGYLKGIVKESSYNTISEAEIDNLMSDVGFVSKLKKLGIVRYGDEAQEVGARCPICNKNLVVRTAKKTGKRFIGCSAFPKCRYIESKEKTEEILLNIKCHKEPDFSIKIMDSINENFDIDSSSKNELIKLVDSIVTLQNLMGKIYYNDVQRLINKIEIDIKESLLKFLLDEFNIDYHEENSYTINPEDAIEYPDDYIDDIEKYILNNIEELFETYGEIDDEDVLLNTLNYHDEIIECGTDFSKFLEKVKVKAYKKNNQMKMVKVKIIDAIMSIVTYLGYKSITSGDAIELLNNYGFDYLKNKTDSTLKRVLNAHSLETFGNEKSYNNNDSRYFWKSDSKTHTLIDRSSFLESIEGMTDKEIVEHINDLLSMAKIFSNKN